MTKDAYYFSHDANARQDPKILEMMSVYGAEGYGWYWIIVEMMREQSGFKLNMQGKYTFNALAMQMHCKPDASKQFVHDCINEFKLFDSDGESFWSNSLLRRMAIREEISQKRREAAQARWGKNTDTPTNPDNSNANGMQMHNKDDANGMQGKERKGNIKESKDIGEQEVFNYYLSKNIINHKKFDADMKRKVTSAIKKHGIDEVKKAIDNYATVFKSDKYWFTQKYSLMDMMRDKDIRQFGSEADPLYNFAKDDFKNQLNIKPTEAPRKSQDQIEHEKMLAEMGYTK